MLGVLPGIGSRFLRRVAAPLLTAWGAYKSTRGDGRYHLAKAHVDACAATDWHRACWEWLDRRHQKFLRANDDGAHAVAGDEG